MGPTPGDSSLPIMAVPPRQSHPEAQHLLTVGSSPPLPGLGSNPAFYVFLKSLNQVTQPWQTPSPKTGVGGEVRPSGPAVSATFWQSKQHLG